MLTATLARFNFDHSIEDVSLLLKYHDNAIGNKRGRPARELEVLKRSAVILTVTAWESYIEDTLRDRFFRRLSSATSPSNLESAFNSAADQWLGSQRVNPGELANWTGDGWKVIIRERFEQDVDSLNTPDSKRVKKLSKRYLSEDLTASWRWQRVSPESAAQQLDALIALRGSLVHRGRELFETRQAVRKKDAIKGKRLVQRLVQSTDVALGIQPRRGPPNFR